MAVILSAGGKQMDIENKTENMMKPRDIFFRDGKTNSSLTDVDRKNELADILYGIMNKLFSAKVVLKQLTNAEIEELKGAEKPIKKIQIEGNSKSSKKSHEGTHYVRICLKCRKPPAKLKAKDCLSCKSPFVYECQKCHKEFVNYRITQRHIESRCFLSGFYNCPVCDYRTQTFMKVKRHVAVRHPSLEYNKNDVKWTDANELLMHECSKCGKQFENHELLNMHIPTCGKAQELFVGQPDGNVRINKDYPKLITRYCPKCNKDIKIYNSGVSTRQPCQQCGMSLVLKCLRCDKQYDLYSSIYVHSKVCSGRRKQSKCGSRTYFECEHCKKKFVKFKWLEKHLVHCKTQRKEQPQHHPRSQYKHLMATCKNCEKTQNSRYRRKICENCKSDLHFTCNICNESFIPGGRGKWCKHLKSHFSNVKYECDHCGAGVMTKDSLIQHLKFCMKECDYYCHMCTYATKFKHNIYNHILMRHPLLES